MPFNRKTILVANIEAREQEIGMYEINIDAYERSLAIIDTEYPDNEAMRGEHRARIESLLKSERAECDKSKLSLRVLSDQLTALDLVENT
jgi:hypothetical protein